MLSYRTTLYAAAAVTTLLACTEHKTIRYVSPGGAGGAASSGEGAAGSAAGGYGGQGGASSSSGSGGGSGGSDPWAGPVESLKEVDLGNATAGFYFTFPIPDRTLGFTLQATAPTPDDIVGFHQLRPINGSNVIFNFAMAGHSYQVFGDLGWCGCANPMTDTSDAWPVQAGSWLTVISGDGSISGADLSVWARRTEDGAFHGGVMDVNVFKAPGTVSNNYLTTVLSTYVSATHFGPKWGVTLGTLNIYDVSSSSYSVINSMDEYNTLLTDFSGSAPTAPALNLFVVADFADSAFGDAIGVAGGIPGSPMVHGTSRSGVAYQPSGDPAFDGKVLAHEIAHVGGLFHTTEIAIDETDPLGDTPSCGAGTIQSNPSSCPDASNLMFPVAYGGAQLTAWQARVLQGSALYRGILEPGGQPAPPLPPPSVSPSPGVQLSASYATAAQLPAPAPGTTQPVQRAGADELEQVLGAVWCAHGGADYLALGWRVAQADQSRAPAARLRQLVGDDRAADLVRARALEVLRLAGPSAAPAAALSEQLLQDNTTGRLLAAAALKILAAHDEQRAKRLAPALRLRRDPALDDLLSRLSR